ncbi:hypothetical protein Misp01_10170 [Microtetraspora sp. NBRC 13810]|uniref:protein kinase domain-containing protein n=1 Tax=Microtetraspora sp. NBRC 13810 TaxID=3030990 RepID=UPI0024A52CBC|nr:protein kinase [Microtetraspora sp. NBRC 13810]GLW05887.1 hypothetical protein Misp01_10170 [Microtetraspora sp. NBRC 13810]
MIAGLHPTSEESSQGWVVKVSALAPEDPQWIGRYWLAGRLGAGGQGVVYEAYGEDGDRVALKALFTHDGAELRDRFEREVIAARRVASFCTARVLDADLAGRTPYIVSEYVAGPSLRRAVQDGRRFAGDDLYRLATAIATALTAVHDAGVTHRDLKPDNVLLAPDGPRVIDFGIARTEEMSLTSTGMIAGTPTYMAPEVFTGRRATAAADVFAWGAIVLYATTGQDPFTADHPSAIIHRVLSLEPDLSPLPDRLRPLVAAALCKDPDDRPTARDLLFALVSTATPATSGLLDAGREKARGIRTPAAPDPGLGTLAEDAYQLLGSAEQELVPDVLLRMITVGDDGRELAKPALLADLLQDRPAPEAAAIRDILNVFTYLISTRDDEIFLSRPAVLRAWPRLRGWVNADKDGLKLFDEVAVSARRWSAHGRKDTDLLQGSRLEVVQQWATTGRRHVRLNSLERTFLQASSGLGRRRVRVRRVVSAVLAVLLVMAVALAGWAEINRRDANDQRWQVASQLDQAVSRTVAAKAVSLRESDPALAMLLSIAAWRIAPTSDARWAVTGSLAQPEVLRRATDAVDLGQDGRSLLHVSDDQVRITDSATGMTIATVKGTGRGPESVHLSADRRFFAATTCVDTSAAGGCDEFQAQVWSTRTGATVGRVAKLDFETAQDEIRFDSRGRLLFTSGQAACGAPPRVLVDTGIPAGAGQDASERLAACITSGELTLVDRTTGTIVDTQTIPKITSGKAALSADGRRIVATWARPDPQHPGSLWDDGQVVDLWEVTGSGTHAKITRLLGRRTYLSAVPGDDFTVQRTGLGCVADHLLISRSGQVSAQDSCHVATLWGSPDRPGRQNLAWRTWPKGVPHLEQLADIDHPSIIKMAFTADGRGLAILGSGDLRVLDMSPYIGTSAAATHRPARAAAFSVDGRTLAVLEDAAVRLVDATTGRDLYRPLTGSWISPPATTDFSSWQEPLRFTPDGRTLAVRTSRTQITLVEVATGDILGHLSSPANQSIRALDFSPDGRTLLAGTDSGIQVWDVTTRRRITQITEAPAYHLYSHGVATVITGDPGDGICLVDTTTKKKDCPASGFHLSPLEIVPLPASSQHDDVVLGGADGSVITWDSRTRTATSPVLRGHSETVLAAALSTDERLLATGSHDNTVRLWDPAAGASIGPPFPQNGDVLAVAFEAGGEVLHSVDVTGTLHSYPLDPEKVVPILCAKIGRDLSNQEWRNHIPGAAPQTLCRT